MKNTYLVPKKYISNHFPIFMAFPPQPPHTQDQISTLSGRIKFQISLKNVNNKGDIISLHLSQNLVR